MHLIGIIAQSSNYHKLMLFAQMQPRSSFPTGKRGCCARAGRSRQPPGLPRVAWLCSALTRQQNFWECMPPGWGHGGTSRRGRGSRCFLYVIHSSQLGITLCNFPGWSWSEEKVRFARGPEVLTFQVTATVVMIIRVVALFYS